MNDQQAWDIYFASVCAMRFHPKNIDELSVDEDELNEIDFAASIADEMLNIRRKKWPSTQQS